MSGIIEYYILKMNLGMVDDRKHQDKSVPCLMFAAENCQWIASDCLCYVVSVLVYYKQWHQKI